MNAQPELSFPSEPIAGETRSTVELVGEDWRADEDWRRFKAACLESVRGVYMKSTHGPTVGTKWVDPNTVRRLLTNQRGELTIAPRRLSAFYNRAAGKDGFLDFSHWGINDDAKGRNKGKPCRIYRLRAP